MSRLVLGRDPLVTLENMRLFRSIQAGSLVDANAALDAGADATEVTSAVVPVPGRASMLHEAVKYAALCGDTDERLAIVRLLIARGASPGAHDEFGNVPLHRAATANAAGAGRALLECGADANARNFAGETPLHLAARYASTKVLGVLLARGADPRLTDAMGHTPRSYATTMGLREVSAMLLAAEARDQLRRQAINRGRSVRAKRNRLRSTR